MDFTVIRRRRVVASLVMAAALAGCSTSDHEPTPSGSPSTDRGRAASDICGGLFGSAGASAVEQSTGDKRFSDLDESHDMEQISSEDAAEKLKNETFHGRKGSVVYLCLFHAVDVRASLQISARWVTVKPDELRGSHGDRSAFNLGDGENGPALPYASASHSGALLLYHCPVGVGRRSDMAMSLSSLTTLYNHDSEKRPEQLTRMMNAAAFTLAQDMGCAESSKLRANPGPLTPLPVVSATPTAD